ncbi:methyl-accepting chemotaxis protein [Oceanospirillum beijerinckii]|uniref:methyl-accepting chemotaxis protein n=1 Tax=Oceanospirillum beijerinckii TaxID=64976 RepID=UPI0006862E56|nr:methyl-accepting chemotaxis protein [Oceanospirillum beijerinckii]
MEAIFRQFRIQYRIWFMQILAFLAMAVLILIMMMQEKESFREQKKSELNNIIHTVIEVLDGMNQEVQNGTMTLEQAQQQALNIIKNMRYGQDNKDYFWVMDTSGIYLMHPIAPALTGKDGSVFNDKRGNRIFNDLPGDMRNYGKTYSEFYWPKPGSDVPVEKMGMIIAYKNWNWAVGSGFYIDEIEEIFWQKVVTNMGIAGVIIIIMLAIAWLLVQSITRPLEETVSALKDINEGDGDLTKRLTVAGNDEITRLTRYFNGFVEKVHGVMGQVNGASSSVSGSAERLSIITTEVHNTTEQQAKATDQVATAVQQMSSTVHEVAQNAGQAAEGANQADQEARCGKAQVAKTIDAINQLSTQVSGSAQVIQRLHTDSENIGSVLDVIRGIAEQTNLLALNAAIEAARAGEQGRGFAVVADEVRTLAQRTQESTDEIQSMIEKLQNAAQDAVRSMDISMKSTAETITIAEQAGVSLDSILQAVESIKGMNDMIASAAEEQSLVAEEINQNVVNIVGLSQTTAQSIHQVNQSSDALAGQADNLHNMVGQFRI